MTGEEKREIKSPRTAALPIAGHITPVPGGVGPMTVACLMFNTLQEARKSAGLPFVAI